MLNRYSRAALLIFWALIGLIGFILMVICLNDGCSINNGLGLMALSAISLQIQGLAIQLETLS
jgi:hypothetical protein